MKKLIIISIILIILGGGVFWYMSSQNQKVDPVTGKTTNDFKSFFSFGDGTNNSNTQDTKGADGEVLPSDTGVIDDSSGVNKGKFKQVTDFAVAGVVTFTDTRPSENEVSKPTDTTAEAGALVVPTTNKTTKVELPKIDIVPALRFVARSNGHIYGQYLDTLAAAKISNTTIPTIYEAIFANEGQFIMYRYLDETTDKIQSFIGTLGGSTSGSFLPENIQSVSAAPSGSQFFYLIPIGNDIAGYVGSFTDTNKTQIFTSAFTEWIPQWAQANTIFMTTKPSYLFSGSMYALNKLTGGFTKVFGGVYGLTTLASTTSNLVLYSSASNGGPTLGLYNLTSHSFTPLGVNTLSEKCVWSGNGVDIYCAVPNEIPSGQYPDSWYQGLVSFNDSIVKINTVSLSSNTVFNTAEINAIDATNLTLSPDEKTLFMINKKDSTLWSLDLN